MAAGEAKRASNAAINPDAHHTDATQQLWFGIGAARKGWLTRDDVVNTRPLKKIETILKAKRAGKMPA